MLEGTKQEFVGNLLVFSLVVFDILLNYFILSLMGLPEPSVG